MKDAKSKGSAPLSGEPVILKAAPRTSSPSPLKLKSVETKKENGDIKVQESAKSIS